MCIHLNCTAKSCECDECTYKVILSLNKLASHRHAVSRYILKVKRQLVNGKVVVPACIYTLALGYYC